MDSPALLSSFPVIRSHDVDEVRSWLESTYSLCGVGKLKSARPIPSVFNHAKLRSLQLTFARYGFNFRAKLENNSFFVQGFPVSGGGKVVWNRDEFAVGPSPGGIVGGPDSDASFDYDPDYSHLVLKLSPDAITRKLTALTGDPIDRSLRLNGGPDPEIAARQRRLVMFLAEELELSCGNPSELVLSGIEDAIIMNFLLETNHNLSHLLTGKPKAAAPWQVRRAVDYIEQHWDQPITIEILTEITETSARSLFLLFKRTHDVSPMVYLSKVRLRHAHEMLRRPEPGDTVTRIGFMCGFSNLGNFALKYFAAFGEKPSETLKNNLR